MEISKKSKVHQSFSSPLSSSLIRGPSCDNAMLINHSLVEDFVEDVVKDVMSRSSRSPSSAM